MLNVTSVTNGTSEQWISDMINDVNMHTHLIINNWRTDKAFLTLSCTRLEMRFGPARYSTQTE